MRVNDSISIKCYVYNFLHIEDLPLGINSKKLGICLYFGFRLLNLVIIKPCYYYYYSLYIV